jgi:hypothetical protein
LSDDRRRVALRPEVSSDDVDRAAYALDWNLSGTHAATGGQPREDIYTAGDDGTRVHLLHDDGIGLRYLIVRGPSADDVAGSVADELATVSAQDAAKTFKDASGAPDKITALYLLGIASDDGKAPEAASDAFDDDDPEVRRAAIVALGYVGGSEAEALVERVASGDPDEKVRHSASVMLEGLREHG